MNEDNGVQEVNIDTIRELRRRGLIQEAIDMLNAYHEQVKKEGKQAYSDQAKKERKIRKQMGMCTQITCSNPICEESTSYCKSCFEKIRKYNGYTGKKKRLAKLTSEEKHQRQLRLNREKYIRNRDEILEKNKNYYRKNRDEILRKQKERYHKSKE